jgi:hypothetical protein
MELPAASRPPPPRIVPPTADVLTNQEPDESGRSGKGRVSYSMDVGEDSTGDSEPASFPRRRAKGRAIDAQAVRRASTMLVINGLGLRAGKTWWGLESWDMGYFARKEEWWEESNAGDRSHSKSHTWWEIPWTNVPSLRHLWGDSQYELHAESQEVFLDLMCAHGRMSRLRAHAHRTAPPASCDPVRCRCQLNVCASPFLPRPLFASPWLPASPSPFLALPASRSFVGVAFRIGTILKISFYACAESAASGHYVDGGGRRLAGSSGSCADAPLYGCTGAVIGVWHGLGPFLCMYLLWQIETSYRARYAASSKVHTACDIVSNLLLLLAGMNLGPVRACESSNESRPAEPYS